MTKEGDFVRITFTDGTSEVHPKLRIIAPATTRDQSPSAETIAKVMATPGQTIALLEGGSFPSDAKAIRILNRDKIQSVDIVKTPE